jgi:membrane protease YdiL (CAAX protease family)
VSPITWVGLFVALFGMLIVRQIVLWVHPQATTGSAIAREIGMWLVAVIIIAIVRVGEGLPLSSIGLRSGRLLKSVLWSLLLTVLCFAAAGVFVAITHFNGGKGAESLAKLPLWLIIAVVIRAGVVEELCYRGYAIERLEALGLPRALAAGVPLIIFGVGHWTGGFLNVLLALLLGAILALFYLWRRDLVANMIGHTLVDFIPNVLPKLFR